MGENSLTWAKDAGQCPSHLSINNVEEFNIFGQPDILLGFNNQETNAVLLQYIYENSVKKQVAGMSSAMAVILGLCIMCVTFIQIRIMVKNNHD